MNRIPKEGKHTLKLVDIKEVPSKIKPEKFHFDFVFETEGKSIVHRAISPESYVLIKEMIDILWPWYGRRVGKSVTDIDLDKLKGRSGVFYIHWEEYRNEWHPIVDTREKR